MSQKTWNENGRDTWKEPVATLDNTTKNALDYETRFFQAQWPTGDSLSSCGSSHAGRNALDSFALEYLDASAALPQTLMLSHTWQRIGCFISRD